MRTYENWYKRVYPKLIHKLTPRIRRDLSQIDPVILDWTKPPEDWYYLFGNTGTGKTIYAVRVALTYCYLDYLQQGNPDFEFLNVGEFFIQIKSTYGKGSEFQESEVLDRLTAIPYLILDDLGVKKCNDWSYEILYILINRRYEFLKPTIITANLSLPDLAINLNDDRITSRIAQTGKKIEFTKILRKV